VLLLASALAIGARSFAQSLEDVREQLAQDIQTAERELSAAEATISRERAELARRLNAAQNRVLDLREQAVAARRLADEETLTLSQLESRLAEWQEQSRFQSRLLASFLDRSGERSLAQVREIDFRTDLAILAAYLDEQESKLAPTWRAGSLVLPDGELGAAELLRLGPVEWFHRADSNESGLVRTQEDISRVAMLFGGSARAGIEDLFRTAKGIVTFDPTLSRALLLAEDEETLTQHLYKGGIWVIPILLFALFASGAAAFKAVSLYRLPPLMPALAERVASARKQGGAAVENLVAAVQGPQAELLRVALADQTAEQREDRLYAALLDQRSRLERWLGAIALTASISPLLGLLGTVSGMITTFKAMTLFGSGDASVVSAGIAEALITTEVGLVVAIPAVLAHALMSRKVKSYFAQLENDAVNLSQIPVRAGSA
jgi:biopolymer transport protein ExbB